MLCHLLIFFKINLQKIQEYHQSIKQFGSMNPDHARYYVGPGLDPNCLQRLSADDTSRQIVKIWIIFQSISLNKYFGCWKKNSYLSTHNYILAEKWYSFLIMFTYLEAWYSYLFYASDMANSLDPFLSNSINSFSKYWVERKSNECLAWLCSR